MEYSFNVSLTAFIDINESDFNLIIESSKNHYDLTIKMSVYLGGWLYGLQGRRDFDKKDTQTELTSRQMQLIIKCLEMNGSNQARNISLNIYKILQEMNKKQNKIYSNLNPKK